MKYETEYQSEFKWFDSPLSKKDDNQESQKVLESISDLTDKAIQVNCKPSRPNISKKLFTDLPSEGKESKNSDNAEAPNKINSKIKGSKLKKTKHNEKISKQTNIPKGEHRSKPVVSISQSKDQATSIDDIEIGCKDDKSVDCMSAPSVSPRIMHEQQEKKSEEKAVSGSNRETYQSPYYDSVKSSEYKEQFNWKYCEKGKTITHANNDILPLHVKIDLKQDKDDNIQVSSQPSKICESNHANYSEIEKPRSKKQAVKWKESKTPESSIASSVNNSKDVDGVARNAKREDNLDLFENFLDNQTSKRPTCSEYSANYLSPTKFHVKDGGWVDDVPPQEFSSLGERPDCNDWFIEVVRLRNLSNTFKVREQAGSFFRNYMATTPALRKKVELKAVSESFDARAVKKTQIETNESSTCTSHTGKAIDETTQTPLKSEDTQSKIDTGKEDFSQHSADVVSVAAQTSDVSSITSNFGSNLYDAKHKSPESHLTTHDVPKPFQAQSVNFSRTVQPLDHYRNYRTKSNVGFDSRIYQSSATGLSTSKCSSTKGRKSTSTSHVATTKSSKAPNSNSSNLINSIITSNADTHDNYIIHQRSKDLPSSIAMPILKKSWDKGHMTKGTRKNDYSSLLISDGDSLSSGVGPPPPSKPQRISYDSLLDTSLSSTSSVANDTLRRAMNRRTYF